MRSFSIFLLLFLLSAALGCSGDDPMMPTNPMPMDRLEAEVIDVQGWDESSVLVYGILLEPGQTVGPAFGDDGEPGAPFEIMEPTWFFWADLEPELLFSHDTSFVYMPEAGGPIVVEGQEWFPVIDGLIFQPDDAVWGTFEPPAPGPGTSTSALRDMVGEPCGPAHAVLVQGFDDKNGFISAEIGRIEDALEARDYEIHRVTHAEEPDADARTRLLASVLQGLQETDRMSQLDIFYVGHGNRNGRWVFGDHEQAPLTYTAEDLAFHLGDVNTDRVNVIVESCQSGNFVNTARAPLEEHLADTELADTVIQVLASSGATQKSRAGLYVDRLLTELAGQPMGEPFDYGVDIPRLELTVRDDGGNAVQHVQNPAPPFEVTPSVPVLFLDEEIDECQVVAHIDNQSYQRIAVIRGAGFGDTEGSVDLYQWGPVREPGAFIGLTVVNWSDGAIEILLPMRSEGYPSDPTDIELFVPEIRTIDLFGSAYELGNYYVQVTTSDGRSSAAFENWEVTNPLHFYRPQLVHISPQIYEEDWTPDYSTMASVEWNEMWHPMTPADPSVGNATVLISNLRLATEPPPDWTLGMIPATYAAHRGNEAHTTGDAALALGGWTYGLEAGERDLATAFDMRSPTINYWGFRQEMDDGWVETNRWTYLLIYD